MPLETIHDYIWGQKLLRLYVPLLHLGPKFITLRTFIIHLRPQQGDAGERNKTFVPILN